MRKAVDTRSYPVKVKRAVPIFVCHECRRFDYREIECIQRVQKIERMSENLQSLKQTNGQPNAPARELWRDRRLSAHPKGEYNSIKDRGANRTCVAKGGNSATDFSIGASS